MIPKSGYRFSEKIMLRKTNQSEMPIQLKIVSLWCVLAIAGAGEMGAQQRDVAPVGAEENVECVAGKRHRANEPFECDIGRYAGEDKPRHAEPGRFVEQITGQQRGDGVADAWNQAKKRFGAEAHIRARQDERGIERGREQIEPIERGAAFRRIVRPASVCETEGGEAAPERGIGSETHCGFAFGMTPQRALDGDANRVRKARADISLRAAR
jgi:hypothetical protein